MMLVYNPEELTELPTRNGAGQPRVAVREPGEQAARAFEMLREGRALDEIVIELRETPDRVDYLNERWLEQTQTRYVITPEAKKALEQFVGPFNSITDLVDLVKKRYSPYIISPETQDTFRRLVGIFKETPDLLIAPEAKGAFEQLVEAVKDSVQHTPLGAHQILSISPEEKTTLEGLLGKFKTATDLIDLVSLISEKLKAQKAAVMKG
jgi:hypothetical protein